MKVRLALFDGGLITVHLGTTRTFLFWRRKQQPTPVFFPGESQGWGSLVGCRLWGRAELDMTKATQQQQQQQNIHVATQQWPQDWKRSVFIPIPKKGNAKECSNYRTIALISHASKVMLKILQARLQQYMNRELPDVQAGFRKGRGTRDQIANIRWIIEKAKSVSEKHLFLLY